MADVEGALPIEARRQLRETLASTHDPFVHNLPKVELHIHIEGCLTADLKWKFSQRNGHELRHPRTGELFINLDQYRASHDTLKDPETGRMNNSEETLSFFEAYYSGFEVLETEQDYFDLAMYYFLQAAKQNVRYAEIFFDPQGHTRTGTKWETMMGGFLRAQREAEKGLNLRSGWIMCFLRDETVESAMECYKQALGWRDMIVGVGLDSNEDGRPPILFREVFERARSDGFKVTAHCDVGKNYPVEHVRQCVEDLELDRVDHGLNVVQDVSLTRKLTEKGAGLTICPWSYIRHQPFEEIFQHIRTLFEAGVRISIGSDDPAFMEDTWIAENLLVLKQHGNFTDRDMVSLMKDSVMMSWAPDKVKNEIIAELSRSDISST